MEQNLTTSVVMATYNGEKYIYEQLLSIFQQTVQANEVIIIDDGSTDNTVSIVNQFIDSHKLNETWTFLENTKNVGWRQNFLNLLNQSKMDIVFTADQDDLWIPNKIKLMLNEFKKNKQISVLVSDYGEKIESSGKSAKLRKIVTDGNRKCAQVLFTDHNLLLLRPGCVFAIKRTFVPQINKYYSILPNPAHDIAMWGAALLCDKLYYLKESTIIFRRHADSSFQKEVSEGLQKANLYQGRIDKLERFNIRLSAMLKFLDTIPNINDYFAKKKIISKKIINNQKRINILQKKNIVFLLTHFWEYHSLFYFLADFKHIFKLNLTNKRYSK